MDRRIWIGGALAAFIVVFILQNSSAVDVHVLFWRISLSTSFLILLAFFAGFATGWLVPALRGRRKGPDKAKVQDPPANQEK